MYTITIENIDGSTTKADPTEDRSKAIKRARELARWLNDYKRIDVYKGSVRHKTIWNKQYIRPESAEK